MKRNLLSSCVLVSVANFINASDNLTSKVENEKPNIVWFLTEDLSTFYLSMYNNGKGVDTPNVRWLAENGITYTNAYSNAPVSSAARTTLITGCYAPKIAGSFHRGLQEAGMPDGLRMFPSYLREAGYYTYNAKKTDYNVELDSTAWDVINGDLDTWRKRPDKSKPFFFQRSNMMTHESQLQFDLNVYRNVKTRHSMDEVTLHPVHPNTELMKYTYATFYDRIEDSDKELGRLINMLREDDLLENTFIFYFGDNGGTLPGTKGYTCDIGLHVPLVIYVPARWREKLGVKEGTLVTDIVSFMDFAPTVLILAGINVPKQMDGSPFLGSKKEGHFMVGYGDRFDELYAFNRTIRKGKYRYVRNYQPYHSQSLFSFYRYKQLAFRKWKDLFVDNALSENQKRFFENFEPEELYDLEMDPYEQNNLIDSPEFQNIVVEMRTILNGYMEEKGDLGFFPETIILEEGINNPEKWGRENKNRIRRFVDILQLELCDYSIENERDLYLALHSEDSVEKFWGLTVCACFGKEASTLKSRAYELLFDNRSFVRMRALTFLAILGERFDKKVVVDILCKVKTGAETLCVLNDLTFLYENELITPFILEKEDITQNRFGVDWRLKYLNSYVKVDNWEDRWNCIYCENE